MEINFQDIGTGSPVVLIHAFPLSARMWKAQAEILPNHGFRVILPDLPGFGESQDNLKGFSIEEMAQQVLEVIASLKIEKAIIGGLSMGGYVLFNLFRIAPEKFSAMILCDTTYLSDTDEKRKGRFELISKIEESGASALIENMLPNLISDHSKEKNPTLMSELTEIFSMVNPQAAINALQSMAERKDNSDMLENIEAPTLLVFGESDKVTNLENAHKMNKQISDSELKIIKNAGHYSNLENTEEFNETLLHFCKRVGLNASTQ
jgi:3-oxoadipate enol-lactonase